MDRKHRPDRRPQVHREDFQLHFPGLELGEIENGIHRRQQLFAASLQDLHMLPLGWIEFGA